jgi:hypothetical protein
MAITTAMCNSFKQELLGGVHDLDTDSLKVALIEVSPSGTYGAGTTNYSDVSAEEAVGTNYTAGGQVLDSAVISLTGSTAIVDFSDEVFSNLTISADGAIIYNASQGNKAIAVFDFGTTVTSTSGDFTVVKLKRLSRNGVYH